MSTGLYGHTTRATGTVLTASIYNTDHQNHITNLNPTMSGSYSDNLVQFQSTIPPGDPGSEVLPSNLAGEIERLRYCIGRIVGGAQWYSPPDSDIATLTGDAPIAKVANYPVVQADNGKTIECNVATIGAFTITLPSTLTAGTKIRVRRTSATSTTALTVAAAALINGLASIRMFGQYDTLSLEWNGSTWYATLDGYDLEEVGSSKMWWLETAPNAKWVLMHSTQTLSRTVYAELFAKFGTIFGIGDNVTTFGIKNIAGRFLRAWDNAAAVDPDAAARTDRGDGVTGDKVGTNQADALKDHTHSVGTVNSAVPETGGQPYLKTGAVTQSGAPSTGAALETRGKNTAVAYLLKVLP